MKLSKYLESLSIRKRENETVTRNFTREKFSE